MPDKKSESPWIKKARDRSEKIVGDVNGAQVQDNVTDVLSDLMLYCHSLGDVDFENSLEKAKANFEAEREAAFKDGRWVAGDGIEWVSI